MTVLEIRNPFNALTLYEETVESTMDVSRQLALNGEPHGTVIAAGFQENGRGRIRGRAWRMEGNVNLPFTILLRFPRIEDIPPALSLRAGLAVCLAIEDFVPFLKGKVMVKWPNDIITGSKKIAGILCEADGGNVFIGVGVNVAQKIFPAPLAEKAASIALVSGVDIAPEGRFYLLERILERLYAELETAAGKDWKARLEQRLYKKDEKVIFIEGAAGSGREVHGHLAGIAEGGELLIADGQDVRSFTTGELVFPC